MVTSDTALADANTAKFSAHVVALNVRRTAHATVADSDARVSTVSGSAQRASSSGFQSTRKSAVQFEPYATFPITTGPLLLLADSIAANHSDAVLIRTVLEVVSEFEQRTAALPLSCSVATHTFPHVLVDRNFKESATSAEIAIPLTVLRGSRVCAWRARCACEKDCVFACKFELYALRTRHLFIYCSGVHFISAALQGLPSLQSLSIDERVTADQLVTAGPTLASGVGVAVGCGLPLPGLTLFGAADEFCEVLITSANAGLLFSTLPTASYTLHSTRSKVRKGDTTQAFNRTEQFIGQVSL